MWSFLVDLVRSAGTQHTVVLMESEDAGTARRYRVHPSRLMIAWGSSLLGVGIIAALLVAFTPVRRHIPGYGTEAIEKAAQLNTRRVRALQDSLAAQRQYVRQLRRLITGRVDSTAQPAGALPSPSSSASEQAPRGRVTDQRGGEAGSEGQDQSAFPSLSVSTASPATAEQGGLSGLVFPLPPPVASGFPTRDFDAAAGHYGIDVAVSEGEHIRAVADGYVVWADWTQDGGYTIAVQHASGYLSVYKHNKRLLKRIGDRVRALEPLAISGNTGAITTGPHLHFELWRNGLAQGPRSYIAGW